jgi:hypothetical protein
MLGSAVLRIRQYIQECSLVSLSSCKIYINKPINIHMLICLLMDCRLHKCFSHCLTRFHNLACYLEFCFNCFMACWEAGLLTL